jgi:2-oxoglutarate dehydrogenase E2 component (dihydrolipoamide succinyltransferase)
MSTTLVMPQLGESASEATISRWLKGVGDRVEAGEPIVEISTYKVVTEVVAPV